MTFTPPPTHAPPGPGPVPPPGAHSGRERFLHACACRPAAPTPIWLMRQAGRVLPEYRALKERHSFLEMVRTPELAAEVTLQPIRRFGFDAAIVFSDILVVPEALGQGYRFLDTGGIAMDFALRDARAVDRLDPEPVAERLAYVAEALRLVRRELAGRTALIGFAGSPWTLANFMIEGGSSRDPRLALDLYHRDRPLYDRLAGRLTDAIIRYLRLQIAAGAEALQLFDTLGSLLPAGDFEGASGRWLRDIVRALAGTVPIIVFAKGARVGPGGLADLGATVLGFDHSVDLRAVRDQLPPGIAIQGNLDPAILLKTPETVVRETRSILDALRGRPGHIFNLGHGVPPEAPLENLETLVRTVREPQPAPEAR
jgi:uroporphyrinogen decarboxylase